MNNTSPNSQPRPLELWGGLECTVNRVQDEYFSQLDRNGHALRNCDIQRFASTRHPRHPLPDPVGTHRPGRHRQGRLVLARRTPACPARRRRDADRRPDPPRQRPARHQPARPRLPRTPGRVCRRRRRALSLARVLHPGQRTLHHRALRRPVRGLVPACARRRQLHPGPADPVPRRGAVHARHPRRQSGCQTGANGRPRQDLQHAGNGARRPSSTTNGAGWPGTCCAAWSARNMPCGIT